MTYLVSQKGCILYLNSPLQSTIYSSLTQVQPAIAFQVHSVKPSHEIAIVACLGKGTRETWITQILSTRFIRRHSHRRGIQYCVEYLLQKFTAPNATIASVRKGLDGSQARDEYREVLNRA
jgi:hypothetical protein